MFLQDARGKGRPEQAPASEEVPNEKWDGDLGLNLPEPAFDLARALFWGQAHISQQMIIQIAQIDAGSTPLFPCRDRGCKAYGQIRDQRQPGAGVQQGQGGAMHQTCHDRVLSNLH